MTATEDDDLSPEFRHAMAAQAGAQEAGVTPEEFAIMMGQAHYLFKDDDVIKFLKQHKNLEMLLIGLSHMIRTSRIDDETVIRELKLRWKMAVRLEVLILNKDPETRSVALFDLLVMYGYAAIEDTRRGWRGKLTTEKIKTYRFESQPPKRKKILGIF